MSPRNLLHLAIALALLLTPHSSVQAQDPLKDYPRPYVNVMSKAIRSFHQRDFDRTLTFLDEADKIVANTPIALNTRGAIAIERRQLDQGRAYLEEVLKKDPNFFPARFNLAEIEFIRKNYPEARRLFMELVAKDRKNELLRYRVFLTWLLEGNAEETQKSFERIKYPGETAAWYYANAAREFSKGDTEKGMSWIRSGDWVFSPEKNVYFADVIYDIGWISRPGSATTPAPATPAAETAPSSDAAPAPAPAAPAEASAAPQTP